MTTRRRLLSLFLLPIALTALTALNALPRSAHAQQVLPHLPHCAHQPEAAICETEWEWDIDALPAQLAEQPYLVWQGTEETLLVVYKGQAETVFLDGAIQTTMNALPLKDVWGIAVRVQGLPTAMIEYHFIPLQDGQPDWARRIEDYWRGPEAFEAERSDPLVGTVESHMLDSRHLTASRQVDVYVPPDHDPAGPLPVAYLADGFRVDYYAAVIEPLILDGTLPPLLLVGVYPAGEAERLGPNDNPRAAEYLGSVDGSAFDNRFAAHEMFFMDEVMAWAEAEFGAATERDQRAIFGTSNGAGFAVLMGERYPNRVANIIAFSIAGWGPSKTGYEHSDPMRYFLLAGTLETANYRLTALWRDALQNAGAEVAFADRIAGHDPVMWRDEVPAAFVWAFGAE